MSASQPWCRPVFSILERRFAAGQVLMPPTCSVGFGSMGRVRNGALLNTWRCSHFWLIAFLRKVALFLISHRGREASLLSIDGPWQSSKSKYKEISTLEERKKFAALFPCRGRFHQ